MIISLASRAPWRASERVLAPHGPRGRVRGLGPRPCIVASRFLQVSAGYASSAWSTLQHSCSRSSWQPRQCRPAARGRGHASILFRALLRPRRFRRLSQPAQLLRRCRLRRRRLGPLTRRARGAATPPSPASSFLAAARPSSVMTSSIFDSRSNSRLRSSRTGALPRPGARRVL